MKSKIRGQLAIGIIAVLILLLWFFMGFIFPLFFDNTPTNNGEFGDGFGSVNALFSGLGFLALAYTLYLQIQVNKNDKKEKQFEIHIKLIDDLKDDLKTFEFEGTTGLNAFNKFKTAIRQRSHHINLGSYNHYFKYILNTISQFEYLVNQIEMYKDKTKYKELLLKKTSLLFLTYLSSSVLESEAKPTLTNKLFMNFNRLGKQLNDRLENRNKLKT